MSLRVTMIGLNKVIANFERRRAHAVEAVKKPVERATAELQAKIRADVAAIFPKSRKASNAIRKKTYVNKGRGAAGIVYSRFGRGKGGAFVDYIGPYLVGATIRPNRARYLTIPLQPGKRHKQDPRKIAGLAPISIGGRLFLVKRQRNKTIFYFLLVPQVKIERRINLKQLAARRNSKLLAAIAGAINKV